MDNLAERQKIDLICDRFEKEWQSANESNPPSLADQLDDEIGDRDELLTQLLALDVAYRKQFSIPLTEDTYRQTLPNAGNAIDRVFGSAVDAETVDELQQSIYTPSISTGIPKATTATEEPLPTQLGRYECIRKLGKGGFGMVVLAKDTELDRQVAIKFARSELRGNERATAFFLNEARTVAELDHPHIAPIYDVGRTDDGSPYFVMKYYPNGDLRSRDKADADLSEVARKFAGLTSGLAAAHQRGIVHRDIKPSNILVGDDGELCLVDFGLALKGDADPTAAAFAGTPNYMSPEQATDGVAIDARSDLFSLGVVFYEQLTGQLPFALSPTERAPDFSQQVAPVRSRNTKVKPRVAAICHRMLVTDRQARYSSATEIAEDLQDAVATKWARRFGIAVATLIILGTCSVGAVRWKALQTERRLASQSAELADFLVDILRSPDPSVDGRTVTVASRLDAAVAYAKDSLANQPLRQANMLFAIGQSYAGLGVNDQALEVLQQTRQLLASRLDADDAQLLRVESHIAVAKQHSSQVKEAIVELEDIKQRWEAAYSIDDTDYRFITGSLTSAYRDDSRYQEAYELGKATLKETEAAVGPEDLETLVIKRNCAELLMTLSRFDESLALVNEVLDTLRERNPRLPLEEMRTLSAMAATQRQMNINSVPAQVEALQIARHILGESHPETLDRMQGLAFATSGNNKLLKDLPIPERSAKELLQNRYRLALETLGPDHNKTLLASVELARMEDDREKGIELLQENLPRFQAVFGESHAQTMSLEQNLANLLMHEKRPAEAAVILQDMIPRMEATFGENGKHVIATDFLLVLCLKSISKNREAAITAEKSANRSEVTFGTDHAKTNTRYFAAIENYFADRNHEKTIELGNYFIEHYSTMTPDRDCMTRVFMADALLNIGKLDQSVEMVDAALELLENEEISVPAYISAYAPALRGKLFHEQGEPEKAKELTALGRERLPEYDKPGIFPWLRQMCERVVEWDEE